MVKCWCDNCGAEIDNVFDLESRACVITINLGHWRGDESFQHHAIGHLCMSCAERLNGRTFGDLIQPCLERFVKALPKFDPMKPKKRRVIAPQQRSLK